MEVPPHNERACGHVLGGGHTGNLLTGCLIQPLTFQKTRLRPREGKEFVEVAQLVRGSSGTGAAS